MEDKITQELLDVVRECLKDDRLINEYCRLMNVKRPDKLSPIEKAIDEACGNNPSKDFFDGFIPFVAEYIYVPMLSIKS